MGLGAVRCGYNQGGHAYPLLVLKYSDIAGLEHSIDTAFQIASQRLFDIFLDKFKLMDHLLALKQYLMLGHGDFADQLMETLG
jgi:gamma-tubulin complex component 3